MSMKIIFKAIVASRLVGDPSFSAGLLRQSVEAMLADDMDTNTTVLRDYIKATIGFPALGKGVGTPAKLDPDVPTERQSEGGQSVQGSRPSAEADRSDAAGSSDCGMGSILTGAPLTLIVTFVP
jgi:hypothetical protein